MVELLVVVAIIGILAGLLLPALSKAQVRAQGIACLANLRQLGHAWFLYASDNNGRLAINYPILSPGQPNPDDWFWGYAAWPHNPDYGPAPQYTCTNVWCAQSSKLFPYYRSLDVTRCPSDRRTVGGLPVVRSVAMNSWLNGRSYGDPSGNTVKAIDPPEKDRSLSYVLFRKEAQLAQPANIWVMIDEDAQSINDSMFVVDMDGKFGLADAPARRHANAYGLNFADGHSEIYRLTDARSINWKTLPVPVSGRLNQDWLRLRSLSTLRNQERTD